MPSFYLATGHGQSTDGAWDTGTVLSFVDNTHAHNQAGGIKPYENEADLMYDVAGYAVADLRASGITVITDWDSDNDMNCTYTIAAANAAGVDAYGSLHCDYDLAPSGTYPIVYPGSSSGLALANAINNVFMSECGVGTRGILQRDDMEVANTNMPACIFETGSIKADLSLLRDSARVGHAYAHGVCNYFGVAYVRADGSAVPTGSSVSATTPAATENKYGFTSVFNSTNYLEVGSEGSDVAQLQRDMNFCGYRDHNGNKFVEDGDFGAATKYGVECVQRFHGLTVDGEYGCDSDISLMCEVADIQRALVEHGYNITVDGASGQESCRALNDFQLRNGLEVDCSCGDATRTKLGI